MPPGIAIEPIQDMTLKSLLPLALVLAFACAESEKPQVASQPPGTAATLRPEVIEELKQRVPELRQERQPEPEPRTDATPDRIPQRVREALAPQILETITGSATFYADKFEGRRTASGIPFRQNQLVAAHRAYPFGTILRVTNLRNDRSVNVRVVDRGPFGAPRRAQRPVIDLSRRAAERLGFINDGTARVRVEVLQWGRGIRTS